MKYVTIQVPEGSMIIPPGARKEFIICAANLYNDGQKYIHEPKNVNLGFVTCGRRHHNCIAAFAKRVGFPYNERAEEIMRTEQQGFLTSTDRWVDRLEALQIARDAGQLITGDGNEKLGLFSEDLY